jgi:hypothetical protein
MHESYKKSTSLKAIWTKLLTTDTMLADKQLNFLLKFLLCLTNKRTKYLLPLIYVRVNKYFVHLFDFVTSPNMQGRHTAIRYGHLSRYEKVST